MKHWIKTQLFRGRCVTGGAELSHGTDDHGSTLAEVFYCLPEWRQSLSSLVASLQKQYFCSGSDVDIYKEAQREAAHLCQPAQAHGLGVYLHLWLRYRCWVIAGPRLHPHHTGFWATPAREHLRCLCQNPWEQSLAGAGRGRTWEVPTQCVSIAQFCHSASVGDNFWHSPSSNPHCTQLVPMLLLSQSPF